jgi:general secretion pathway protein K
LVIAATAAAAMLLLQTSTTVTRSRASVVRLQGLADGVLRMAAVSLLTEHVRHQPGLALAENGRPALCSMPDGTQIEIAVQDQAGLIDINVASRPVLEDAFRGMGLPASDAATIAAEIIDWRDEDDDPEPNGGAEIAQYRARGLDYGPRNAPFPTIDEIELLPSMTEAIAAKLRPILTVYNPSGIFDPSVVPTKALLGTVAGSSLDHQSGFSPHQFYEIRVVAFDSDGSRAGRASVLSVGGRTVGLMTWRTNTDIVADATTHPACAAIAAALQLD